MLRVTVIILEVNMKKKAITITLVLALALTLLAGCGGNADDKTIVIGATPVPHTEILEFIVDKMADEGFELQIKTFTDYVQPNLATDTGELDANFFQHVPYMENFNEEHGTNLVSVFPVHFEPFGLYGARVSSLDELPDGAVIAVPNDVTNGARALNLLEEAGLIKMTPGVGLMATKLDIMDNPKNIDIREIEAAQIPLILPDVDMATMNGNYALQAGLHVKDAILAEEVGGFGATTFANPIVVNAGNENDPAILALIKILNTAEVRNFINDKYEGAVVPVF